MFNLFAYFATAVVGIVLTTAGLLKLLTPFQARVSMFRSLSLGEKQSAALAFFLPWLELSLGLLGLSPRGWFLVNLITFLLLAIFSAFIWIRLLRGQTTQCGCFGETRSDSVDPFLFTFRNGFLLFLSAITVVETPEISQNAIAFTILLLAIGYVLLFAILTTQLKMRLARSRPHWLKLA